VKRKGARARLFAFAAIFSTILLATAALGVVLTGPLQSSIEGQTVPIDPSATPTAPSPAPEPAISAPAPSPSPEVAAADIFTAPPVTILPPPPPSPGRTSTGAYKTYLQYCAAPATPYTTSSGDFTALLTLTNKERARIGLSPLSWSSSLASTALSWSQAMAAADDAVPGDPGAALAHNPSRPHGGENVATNYWTLDGVVQHNYASQATSLRVAERGWIYSYGHCTNLMNPHWTVMGAGGVQSTEGVWYWTENFQ